MRALIVTLLLGACASEAEPSALARGPAAGGGAELAAATRPNEAAAAALPRSDADSIRFRTTPFSVPAGMERYLCYAQELQDDAVISGYHSAALPYVHHLVLARTLAPEPAGISECDVLFRMTWDPLYISGAGDSALAFPSGSGHNLPKGTQLVLQMHLLNTGDRDLDATVEVELQRTAAPSARPVNTYIFGTTQLELPPKQVSRAESSCIMTEPVQLVAGFPHMHALGRSLRFDIGPSPDQLRTVFARDPYDFDDQHSESVDIALAPGDLTRVTCEYDNPEARAVGFGESTRDEMCFFIGFALDQTSIKSCATR